MVALQLLLLPLRLVGQREDSRENEVARSFEWVVED